MARRTCSFKVLDGNHRESATSEIFPGTHSVLYQVYYEFPEEPTRIIANYE